jgi:hypothetical protein
LVKSAALNVRGYFSEETVFIWRNGAWRDLPDELEHKKLRHKFSLLPGKNIVIGEF